MKYVGGNPYFTSGYEKVQQYKSLNQNINCDVLIVGGGVTGALCSYFFRKNNIDTILIEDELIGNSSTSICTSILEYEIDIDLSKLKNFIGENSAITCFKLCQEAVNTLSNIINELKIDCDFKTTPCFYYSNNEDDISQFKTEFKARKDVGFNVTYIDSDKAKTLFPFDVKSGILTEGAAATFHPYKFTYSIIKKLSNSGLKVFEKTRLVNSEILDGKVICYTSTGKKIISKKVVICTGYAAASTIKENIATLTRTFNIVTSPISDKDLWYKNCTIIDNGTPYTYIRTTPDNRIIIGGEDINDLDYDLDKIDNSYNTLKGKLRTLFPNISNYTIDYKYNGIFADSKECIPYIGEHVDFPNFYFCLGYGSNGVLYSTFGAEMLANLYLGIKDPNLDIFKFTRD